MKIIHSIHVRKVKIPIITYSGKVSRRYSTWLVLKNGETIDYEPSWIDMDIQMREDNYGNRAIKVFTHKLRLI